jgi:hypothetical protein
MQLDVGSQKREDPQRVILGDSHVWESQRDLEHPSLISRSLIIDQDDKLLFRRRERPHTRSHAYTPEARVLGREESCSSTSGWTLWRTSEPCTQKMTSSAILVA